MSPYIKVFVVPISTHHGLEQIYMYFLSLNIASCKAAVYPQDDDLRGV